MRPCLSTCLPAACAAIRPVCRAVVMSVGGYCVGCALLGVAPGAVHMYGVNMWAEYVTDVTYQLCCEGAQVGFPHLQEHMSYQQKSGMSPIHNWQQLPLAVAAGSTTSAASRQILVSVHALHVHTYARKHAKRCSAKKLPSHPDTTSSSCCCCCWRAPCPRCC